MTAAPEERRRFPPQLLVAVLAFLPGAYLGAAAYLHLPHPELPPALAATVFGAGIVGAAFVLAWAAEAAQVDISAGLALAVLAVLAVLPEYAVDFVFTYQAGQVYEQNGECVPNAGGANPCSLALANMTGANRVLVGVGWPLVVLVATWAALRNRRAGGAPDDEARVGGVRLAPAMSTEVVFLGIATLYSLTLPLRTTLTLVDGAVFVTIFALYAWRLSKAPPEEPELIGVSAWVGKAPRPRRRTLVTVFFGVAALAILAVAEHFSTALVDTGQQFGVDQFLLVQWIAPLASESPELIVACLYAWRLAASNALGALLSSKVNQWTLLVGTIPMVFALSATTTDGLPIDTNQRLELLLTAAQSLYAVAILVNLSLTLSGAVTLLALFGVQFTVSVTASPSVNQVVIVVLSVVYLLLAVGQLVRRRSRTRQVIRNGLATPFDALAQQVPGRGV